MSMPFRIPLMGGAYSTKSVLGSNQTCLNLYPEKPRKDGPNTYQMYQRPGLRQLALPPVPGLGRGVFRSSKGVGYTVVGQNLYLINPDFSMKQVGQLQAPYSNLCSLGDNGTTGLLADGSSSGYQFVIADGSSFAAVVDPAKIFEGSIKVDYIDTFMLWPLPNSLQFGSTYSNELVFDATYTAGKTGYPDNLVTLVVNRHQILLLGQVRSEIWYNAGNPNFPFALLPGAYVEWGCRAPYSVAQADINVFWIAQGQSGTCLVVKQSGYQTKVISNYAISHAMRKMIAKGADISDAVGYTYTDEGHIFYVLNFVSGDQTWVYDASIEDVEMAWHQRGYSDGNGNVHRERAISAAFLYGTNVVQDWQNGTLYALDPNYYFDYVDDGDGQGPFARPISYRRSFPQIYAVPAQGGQVELAGRSVKINNFVADFECGNGPLDVNGKPPSLKLRVSFDRGRSWGNFVLQSTGNLGYYATAPQWGPIGVGRWPMFELEWSFAAQATLNGGFIEADLLQV